MNTRVLYNRPRSYHETRVNDAALNLILRPRKLLFSLGHCGSWGRREMLLRQDIVLERGDVTPSSRKYGIF